MTRRSDDIRPALDEWQAELLRLTAFCAAPIDYQQTDDWFRRMTGEDPDARFGKPKERHWTEAGSFGVGKMILQIQGERIDWLSFPSDTDANATPVPGQASLPLSLEPFRRLIHEWLTLAPPIGRLAVGIVVKRRAESRADGYRQLSRYLPFDLDAENSSDFTYTINRWRTSQSGIPNLKINRVSKWGVGNVASQFGLAISAGKLLLSPPADLKFCIIEIDVNTDADFEGRIPEESLRRIFDELVELGTEIVREGDIP